MRRVYLASAIAVLMLAAGLWLFPRQTESTALADMAIAMTRVSTVHFMGFAVDSNGNRRSLEGWVKGGNRLRIRIDGTKDIADDGTRLIAVDLDHLPKVTIRVSGAWPGLAQGMTYLDLFNEPGALRSAMAGNGAEVISTSKVILDGGREGVATELGGDGGAIMRIVTDAGTNLLVKSETYSASGEVVESIQRVEYDVPVADSAFRMSIPKNLPVVDLFGPRVDAVTGGYNAELARLNADPNATKLLTISRSGHGRSSSGTWFHPDFQFEVLGRDPVAVYYLADRNIYRILGEARAFNWREHWYSQPVENGDIRLPGEPRIEVVLMLNGKPGDFCGTEPSSMYRLQNMGPGNATITYHRIKDAYVIRGTAKVLPIGKVYTNDVVKLDTQFGRQWGTDIAEYINSGGKLEWGSLPPKEIVDMSGVLLRPGPTLDAVAKFIESGGKLDWGDLPPSETQSMKADLDVALRLYRIQNNRNWEGHTVIDGARVHGQYGTGSQVRAMRFEAAGPGTRIWVLDVPSRRQFHIIGRSRIVPANSRGEKGFIVKNGVVSYDGKVLSSEE